MLGRNVPVHDVCSGVCVILILFSAEHARHMHSVFKVVALEGLHGYLLPMAGPLLCL